MSKEFGGKCKTCFPTHLFKRVLIQLFSFFLSKYWMIKLLACILSFWSTLSQLSKLFRATSIFAILSLQKQLIKVQIKQHNHNFMDLKQRWTQQGPTFREEKQLTKKAAPITNEQKIQIKLLLERNVKIHNFWIWLSLHSLT